MVKQHLPVGRTEVVKVVSSSGIRVLPSEEEIVDGKAAVKDDVSDGTGASVEGVK